jgi:integrase/recombinase XerD
VSAVAVWEGLDSDPTRNLAYLTTASGQAVDDYLTRRETGGLAARTLDSYRRDLAQLCLLYPRKAPGDFTQHDLETALRHWTLSQRNRARSAFRGFFDDLADQNGHDPAKRLPRIRVAKQHIIDIFDEAEQTRLTSLPELRDRAPATVLLETGLRKSEARHLTVADIDLEGARLSVRRGKGNKGRVIPLWPSTVAALNDLILLEGLNRHDHIWYTRYVNLGGEYVHRDKPAGDGAFHRWWVNLCDTAGVRYRNPHVCRHTYATTLLRRGVSMQAVSRLLGHASISTTVDIYAHLVVDDLAAEIDRALSSL